MGSSGFAFALIIGIVLFVTGASGKIAIPLIAIGGIGTVVTAFTGKSRGA